MVALALILSTAICALAGFGAGTGTPRQASAVKPPSLVFVDLGDPGAAEKDLYTIGLEIVADDLRGLIPLLDEQGAETVVFRFNLSGGSSLEAERIARVLLEGFGPRFRTVAWVRTAGNSASLPALSCEELYFETDGRSWAYQHQGFCDLRRPDEVRLLAARAAMLTDRDVALWNGLLALEPLSVDRDEEGVFRWRNDLQGELLLREPGQDLVLDPATAIELGLSHGTAATEKDLLRQIGIPDAAITREASERLRAAAARARREKAELEAAFDRYVAAANAMSAERDLVKRESLASEALELLGSMEAAVAENPRLMLFVFSMTDRKEFEMWCDGQHRLLAPAGPAPASRPR